MASISLNAEQSSFQKKMSNNFLLRLFLLFKIPLGFLGGMKVVSLTPEKAVTTIPFKWLNRNPFKSMYFGVQGMAAELSTGTIALMAIKGHTPSVAGIVTGFEGSFHKQAKDRVFFTCEDGTQIFQAIKKCIETQEGQTVKVKTVGKTKDGVVVSDFIFTWSFKQRSS
ncbi:MAG: DUF4442 domain-containing protein [Reichenbachiella sp.]